VGVDTDERGEGTTQRGGRRERKSDFDIRDYSSSYAGKFCEQMCFICFRNTRIYVHVEVLRYRFVRNNANGVKKEQG